jgi:hypothetical protein
MGRTVKRLSGLEIDEVSLVDTPANQHGLVAIAKSHTEDSMSVYDAEGNEVFEEELGHGDRVYDDAGNEFVFVEGDTGDAGVTDGTTSTDYVDDAGEYDEREVGKGFLPLSSSKVKAAGRLGRQKGRAAAAWGREAGERAGAHVHERRGRYGAGAGVAAGAGAGYAGGRVGKSLGDQVLEELSKSLTEGDRDEVIAKALDRFDEISKRNDRLEETVEALIEEREAEGYFELAKGYELPIDPNQIGGIMHRAAQFLPEEDLQALDRVFSSVGQVSKAAYEQIGYDGSMDSDVLGQVFEIAGQAVSKSDSSLSQEQAVTALFSANPAAYDEYEAEQRRR